MVPTHVCGNAFIKIKVADFAKTFSCFTAGSVNANSRSILVLAIHIGCEIINEYSLLPLLDLIPLIFFLETMLVLA